MARSPDFLMFYDWETGKLIRKIDIVAKKIFWNDLGTSICISTQDDFYILSYNKEIVSLNLDKINSSDGFEDAFTLQFEVHESVKNK